MRPPALHGLAEAGGSSPVDVAAVVFIGAPLAVMAYLYRAAGRASD